MIWNIIIALNDTPLYWLSLISHWFLFVFNFSAWKALFLYHLPNLSRKDWVISGLHNSTCDTLPLWSVCVSVSSSMLPSLHCESPAPTMVKELSPYQSSVCFEMAVIWLRMWSQYNTEWSSVLNSLEDNWFGSQPESLWLRAFTEFACPCSFFKSQDC